MKKLIIIILTFVMILSSFSIASSEDIKSWSLLIPFDNNTHTLLNIIMCNGKISVTSVEINSELNGYPYAVNNGVLEIEMEDGIHKAQIVDDHLFYQLLPDSYTVMLDHVEDFDPVFSTADGSFNIDALSVINSFKNEKIETDQQREPIKVPSGVYVAGEDFPAGVYRIELIDESKSSHVRLYESMEKVTKAFSYDYDYDLGSYYGSSVVGKIQISEGNALEIRGSSVLLVPYEGLK